MSWGRVFNVPWCGSIMAEAEQPACLLSCGSQCPPADPVVTLHPQPTILLTACCLWPGVPPLHKRAEAPLQLLLCPLLTRCRLPYGMLWLLSCSAPSSFYCCSVQLKRSLLPMQAKLAPHAYG